jgi:sigma-B regulation protein RsbU (phosphoserine phosphatase)
VGEGRLDDVGSGEAVEDFYAALLDDDAVALYERAPCGYLSTTPDGTIVKVNRTFLTITGYERSDLVGRRSFSELLTAGGRMYHETHYAPMLQLQGTAREIALEIVCADGHRLPVLVNSVMERDSDGAPVVIRTAIFDATTRRGYERELLGARQRAQESERRAMLLAQTLQLSLMPPSPPSIPGLDVAAVFRPAGDGSHVGGDFYDIFELATDDWVIAVGDVSGKGAGAAAVTALARYTIRAAAVRQTSPALMLTTVNEVLLRDASQHFCTAVVLRLRRGSGQWTSTVCAGGHPLPLLLHTGSAAEPEPVGRPGSLLGLFEGPLLHDVEVPLRSGDELVLYTDGVTEGRRDTELYGEARLCASLSDHAGSVADDLVQGVLSDVLAFQSDHPSDDIAVVAVRVP